MSSLALSLPPVSRPSASAAKPSSSDSWGPESQSGMTIRKTVHEIRLGFHVSSQNGRPIPELQPNQFAVYEDDQPVEAVTGFYADENLPLRLLLMIDASDSMTRG